MNTTPPANLVGFRASSAIAMCTVLTSVGLMTQGQDVSEAELFDSSNIASSFLPPGLNRPRPTPPAFEETNIVVRDPLSNEEFGTGARRPSEEEWAWGERNLRRIQRISLNAIGLERVNRDRSQRGQPPLDSLVFEAPSTAEPGSGGTTTSSGTTSTGTSAPASLPGTVDNSTLKFFPPIRSQGSLGSCAQFCSVYYAMTHMTALARDWDAKNGGDTLRFSPKWTYNMVNGGQNVGSWHYDAYAIAQKHGLARWADFPYDSNYAAWSLNPTTWWNALYYRANQTGKISRINGAGLDQVKQLLVNGYVLNFATYINSWVWGTAGNDPSTPDDDALAGKPCVTMVNGTSGGHCMTIVGFNDALWIDLNSNGVVDSGEKGALRIANSWGTSWREAGFCWVSYKSLVTRNPSASNEGLAWYDEATWVTARSSYTPRLVAQFNVNHAKRSQLALSLGIASTTQTSPTTVWTPNIVLWNVGGALAFNGTTTAVPGTFYLDFTDLAPMTAGAKRFFLRMNDSSAADPATLSSFTLVDPIHNTTLSAGSLPITIDASQSQVYVDYDVVAGSVPPNAVVTASATSGTIPLVVTLDASASTAPGGSIAGVSWNFGDGTTGAGATVQKTYTQAGSFTATATVTDSFGAQSAASVVITAIDPNVVNAPSAVSATAAARTVTVSWNDNSSNETGFTIERATKLKTGISAYSVVGTVGANVKTFSETVPANTYYYRVKAFNASTGRSSSYASAPSLRVR